MNRLQGVRRVDELAELSDWGAEHRFNSEQLLLELRTKLYYRERS